MKNILTIGGKLALIGAVAAFALALINSATAPVIEKNKAEALAAALSAVVTEGKAGDPVSLDNKKIIEYYPISSGSGISGYVLKLIGDGYGGDLVILASYTSEGRVMKVKLLENSETPGLGKAAEEDEYLKVFENTGIDKVIPLWKSDLDSKKVEEITGASVTYYGISQAVKNGSDFIKSGMGDSND